MIISWLLMPSSIEENVPNYKFVEIVPNDNLVECENSDNSGKPAETPNPALSSEK